jgi:beta-N-acetylhexosaminidase
LVDLKGNPFYLGDEDIQWVENTLSAMGDDEKAGQLFCLISNSCDEEYLKNLVKVRKPGGLMCRVMPLAEVVEAVRILQENSDIPMLIAANLEHGGSGIIREGTRIGCELQVAATDEDETAYRLGLVCGAEGAAAGCNWAFAPVIDIDFNFRNPITNTRTFGSDCNRVRRMGVQYVKGVQKCGVAASIKHFPGDGTDERDQHLVTAVNSMSCEEWDGTYGEVYRACIDAGAMTAMVGHIMQPAYTRKFSPGIRDNEILPASLSYELTTKLLREQLGFNGLIVTDATTMAGMVIPMPRARAVPQVIAAGCDMFLFTRNMDEDYYYMKKGIEGGIITERRLNEALTRILALKAALKLHRKKADGTILPVLDEAMKVIGSEKHRAWAAECADKSVTLVKEEKNVLPISPDKYKRVLFYGIESKEGHVYSVRTGVADMFGRLLEKEGFEVEQYEEGKKGFEGLLTSYGNIVGSYDLIIYLANMATKSNQTVVRIEWEQPMGANAPIYLSSVPTIFISVENPYHLLDVPRVRTFINAYSSSDIVLEALMDKLAGRSEFKGRSPVDAFCGKWDARL